MDESDFLIGDDTSLEFSLDDFDIFSEKQKQKNRYIKPKFNSVPLLVKYGKAAALAREVKLFKGEQVHAIVRGDFIFGDFIEALLVEKNVVCHEMHLSTLSMSQDNIDSIAGLMDSGHIERLVIMLSNYFYSHEKHRLMKYLLDKCDIDNRLEVIICRNHTKISLMEIGDYRIILSGSSNLRSSMSIEQFILQEDRELYAFYKQFFEEYAKYSIIDGEVAK